MRQKPKESWREYPPDNAAEEFEYITGYKLKEPESI